MVRIHLPPAESRVRTRLTPVRRRAGISGDDKGVEVVEAAGRVVFRYERLPANSISIAGTATPPSRLAPCYKGQYRLTELTREISLLSVNTLQNRPDFILASSS
jgi:hypothetical protein